MKKYLFGALALVLAIGFSAFSVKKSNQAVETFYFIGDPAIPSEFTQHENWSIEGQGVNPDITCNSEEIITCSFEITDTQSPVSQIDSETLSTNYEIIPGEDEQERIIIAVSRSGDKKTDETTGEEN